MYYCKDCARPVEQAIEGELICTDCWQMRQTDIAMARHDKEMSEYFRWAESHCEGCGVESLGGMTCPDCSFVSWELDADACLYEWAGLYVSDCEDLPWRDWFNNGMKPDAAAERALAIFQQESN